MNFKKAVGLPLISLLFSLIFCYKALAAKPIDTYYLNIGSGHYLHDFAKFTSTFTGFNDVLGACSSSMQFGKMIESFDTKFGIQIISKENIYVTKKQIIDSASAIITFAVNNSFKKNRNAVIIFYYCGHGMKADSGTTLFLVPGDFVCEDVHKSADLEKNALSINQLVNQAWLQSISKLKLFTQKDVIDARSKISFCFLFDCCYAEKTNNPTIDSLEQFTKPADTLNSRYDLMLRRDTLWKMDVAKMSKGLAKFMISRKKSQWDSAYYSRLQGDEGIYEMKNFFKLPILFYFAVNSGHSAEIVDMNNGANSVQFGPLCYSLYQVTNKKRVVRYYDLLTGLKSFAGAEKTKKLYQAHSSIYRGVVRNGN
jgi:hypothetical protein